MTACYPHSYRPTPVLNTCGHCGLKTSFPLAFSKSKPVQMKEKGWNMTHYFFHCPGVLLDFAFHTRLLCESLCVGLEYRQFLHGSLTINTSLWCLWFDWQLMMDCFFFFFLLRLSYKVLIQSTFHFRLWTTIFLCWCSFLFKLLGFRKLNLHLS